MQNLLRNGAKKYAYTKWVDTKKVKKDSNVIETKDDKSKILEITVAGVPKSRCTKFEIIKGF